MTFKDILVHVDNGDRAAPRLAVAAALAQAHQAHLTALNVRVRPLLPQYIAVQYGAEVARVRDGFNAQAAAEAKALFDRIQPAAGAATEWRDVEGGLDEIVALHARYADVTVIGQNTREDGEQPLADNLVLTVGRPLVVVPEAGTFPTIGERVLVAWNGSREATRAVHDALPILVRARQVHVIAINPQGGMAGHGDVPGADICLHLVRHGVNAVCEHVQADDLNAGQMLLSRAADEGVDLIVMGAYGHARWREQVLGGVTRHMLRHMTVPVLLSH